ncbi:MAG: hypothetical protein LBL13_11235, partial [Bacteroidales bacterium]|nr:hypothetical protein [Bacteroidales bacterium]
MGLIRLYKTNTCIIFLILCLLCLLSLQTAIAGEEQYQQERQKAMSAFEILDKSGNYQEQLTMADLNSLPMGIKRTFGNVEYTVAVSRMRTGHSYAELTIYGRIKIPQGENKVLFFGAQGIKFSYDGDFHGDCKLMLLSDVDIPINGDRAELILHGGFDNATGQGVEKTFFTMDCSGFKELNIVADVVFPESLIRKVGDNGEPVSGEAGRVSAPFHTVVSDWNDILVSLSVPRFEITGLDGFIFDVKNAVFDFSDSRNEAGIQFPDGYENGYLVPGNTDLWRGVYIRELSVVLPPQFAIRESSQRISFAANNMLLDNNGVSGLFEADNILPIESGSAGGWRFSVDRFSMTLEASQIVGAGFAGYIGLPVSEVSELAYEAFISPDNEYLLKVQPAKDIAFDVWSARAEILANSYVKMEVIDGRFRPEALLNGSLSISAKQNEGGKSIAELESVKFTGLHLQTVAPYIEVQSMGYSGEMKLKNFPLSISKIELTAAGDEAKLAFDAKLSLVGDKVPITADTRLELVGAISESGGIQR